MVDLNENFLIRWSLPLLVSLILFGNHYVRDTPGALEKQLELEIHNFTVHDYSVLNALYFFPNIITPLFAGMFIEKMGGIRICFLISTVVAAFGHLIFAMGIQMEYMPVIFVGKAISGCMYEIIDAVMPVVYLGGLFKDDFQLVVSFMQVFIRLGSVANFFLSPILYTSCGLKATIWISSLIGSSSICIFLLCWYIETHFLSTSTATTHIQPTSTTAPKPSTPIITSSSHTSTTWLSILLEYTQLHQFSSQFYCYFLAGACMYGAIVPFWFNGSKYFQDTLSLDMKTADMIMTIPETLIVVVGIPLGLVVTRYHWSSKQKLYLFSTSLLTMAVGYGCMVYTAATYSLTTPALTSLSHSDAVYYVIVSVIILGIGFAFCCQLFWGLINQLTAEIYLSQASGLVSAGVNVLPSVFPPIVASITLSHSVLRTQHYTMLLLGCIALVGCVFALFAGSLDTHIVNAHHHHGHVLVNGNEDEEDIEISFHHNKLPQQPLHRPNHHHKQHHGYEMVTLRDDEEEEDDDDEEGF